VLPLQSNAAGTPESRRKGPSVRISTSLPPRQNDLRRNKGKGMDKHPIRFGVQTGQQNIEWEQLRSFWAKADGWGYDSLWAFDHFYPIFVPDPTGPCME